VRSELFLLDVVGGNDLMMSHCKCGSWIKWI